jgi:signal transduction histidine kinase
VAPLIATYTVSSRLEWRRSWLGLVLSVVVWVTWAFFDPLSDTLVERVSSLVWLTPAIIAWLLGALARAGRLNAEQRSLNREQRASRAVAEERSRIARELHDVIGHSVSVMTVQASAVRRRLAPEQAVERQALEVVESVGREALAEMRRMVGALRDADQDHAHDFEPMPGLDQVDRLADKFRAAGLPVSVSVTGAQRGLAPGLDLTAYRIVQEGLTNTLRHARDPQRVEVVIDYGPDRIELAMRDDGRRPAGSSEPAEAGNGLLGMQERVAVYGGSLVAHVRPEGGFELVATLPVGSG